MKNTIRILIADDHPFFIEGVLNTLRSYPQYQIVSSVTDGRKVIDALVRHTPDLVLLDINMPGRDGISLAKEIRELHPDIRIMLLTMYLPADIRLQHNESFFDAYVLKNSGSEVLIAALDKIEKGERFLDPNIGNTGSHASDTFAGQLKLSSREKEILQLLISGLTNKQIADKLFLSELTIKTHRKNIMGKMGAHNLADLVRKS